MRYLCLTLIVLVLYGCGASSGDTASPAETPNVASSETSAPSASTPPGGAVAETPFDGMAFGERKEFMKDVVMPELKPMFVAEHPDFSCVSCHGEDMKDINFEMPNTLDPLNPSAMPFDSEDEKIKQTAAWMKEEVVPKMAGLLQEEIYNKETKQGFGCFECHAVAAE